MNFAIIGGDRRYLTVAEQLSDVGHVRVFGVDGSVGRSGIVHCGNVRAALSGCDAVILPIPAVKENGCINAFSETSVDSSEFAELVPKGALCIGGMFSTEFCEALSEKQVKMYDLSRDERFMAENAYISAEGALLEIMGKTGRSVLGERVGVVGFGRIGKYLSHILRALGAEVYITARSESALDEAISAGFITYKMNGCGNRYSVGSDFAELCRIICNTVPARVFDSELLGGMHGKTLIELASLPGGFQPEFAREVGVNVKICRGIPGKYAPKSAGKVIADSVCRILCEEGRL